MNPRIVPAAFACLAFTSTADAQELSVEAERGVQVAAITAGYAFAFAHTAIIVDSLIDGEPLPRSWASSTILSGISLAGMAGGYIVLANDVADTDRAASYLMTAPPGLMLGGAHLGFAIDGIRRGGGGFWMDRGPAVVTLAHGTTLSTLGWVLGAHANSGSSDLSKIAPIYTWGVTGALVASHALLSLLLR